MKPANPHLPPVNEGVDNELAFVEGVASIQATPVDVNRASVRPPSPVEICTYAPQYDIVYMTSGTMSSTRATPMVTCSPSQGKPVRDD